MRGKFLSCDARMQIFAQHVLPLLQNKHYLMKRFMASANICMMYFTNTTEQTFSLSSLA